jgi:hypothetical protein
MACRLTIDLSPPLSPALLPPEVYAELYRSYVSAYRSIGFALLGRNTPKSHPASPPSPPPTLARNPRKSKPEPVRTSEDNAPHRIHKVLQETHRDLLPAPLPASYAAAAASPPLSSPSVKRPPQPPQGAVKVTAPVSTPPQPKPNKAMTHARAGATPPTPAASSELSKDQVSDPDSEMLDSADAAAPVLYTAAKPFPVPTWAGKDPSRPFGLTVIGQPREAMAGYTTPLVVYRVDDPVIDDILKKIENAALPFKAEDRRIQNPKLQFDLPAEQQLLEEDIKQFGMQVPGTIHLFPVFKRSIARLKGCDVLATPLLHTVKFPSGEYFWCWQHAISEKIRLQHEYGVQWS